MDFFFSSVTMLTLHSWLKLGKKCNLDKLISPLNALNYIIVQLLEQKFHRTIFFSLLIHCTNVQCIYKSPVGR